MNIHFILISIIGVGAFSSYLNDNFLKLSKTIGFTIFSMIFSLLFVFFMKLCLLFNIGNSVKIFHDQIQNLDFQKIVMNYLVGYLLYATALHTNILQLKKNILNISYLATIGVLVSATLTGLLLYFISNMLGFHIELKYFFIFGALISPTDPVAVFNVLKNNENIPQKIKKIIIGESLFNDATGILLLTFLITIFLNSGKMNGFQNIFHLIMYDIVYTVFFAVTSGLIIGEFFLKKIKTSETGILITLFSAGIIYNLSQIFNLSAPLSMVIFGLISGYYLNISNLDGLTKINDFWDIIDELLNSFLFVLIGLKILTMKISLFYLITGFIGINIITFSRYISIILPFLLLNKRKETFSEINQKSILITLGGVRGGISLALALSINNLHNSIIYLTYSVVILSIIFQSILFEKYSQRYKK